MKMNSFDEYLKPLYPIETGLKKTGFIKENIQVVLFDIYGTLFISGSGDIGIAEKQYITNPKVSKLLNKYSISIEPDYLIKSFHKEIKDIHKKKKLDGIDFPEVEIDQVWTAVLDNNDRVTIRDFAVEFELIVNPVYPMPNIETLLSVCKEKSILMGIISNAQFYTPLMFRWFFNALPEYKGFNPELIFYSYKYGYAKPSSFLFKKAKKKLEEKGVDISSVVYLGNDMLNDIYPAQKCGFRTILFAGDKRSVRLREDNPKCKNLKPDMIITDLNQLSEILQ